MLTKSNVAILGVLTGEKHMKISKILKPAAAFALPVLAVVAALPAHAQTACVTNPATTPLVFGTGALACGEKAFAVGENSTGVGTAAVGSIGGTAVGAGSLAIAGNPGASVTVNGVGPAAIVPDTEGTAAAFGLGAYAVGSGSVAIGDQAGVGIASVPGPNLFKVQAIEQGTAIGSMSAVTATGGTALGFKAQATADNSVAIGSESIADQANTVSIGTVGGERRMVNLAAGVAGTDAVNVNQLNAEAATRAAADTALQNKINTEAATRAAADTTLQTNINAEAATRASADTTLQNSITAVETVNTAQTGQINTLTTGLATETNARLAGDALLGERLDDLSFDLRRNGREARAGTSAALAAAGLPQAMDAGRSMIAAGVGAYRGRAAFALGASHRLSSGNTVMKVGVTYDSSEHVGANAGVGFQF